MVILHIIRRVVLGLKPIDSVPLPRGKGVDASFCEGGKLVLMLFGEIVVSIRNIANYNDNEFVDQVTG